MRGIERVVPQLATVDCRVLPTGRACVPAAAYAAGEVHRAGSYQCTRLDRYGFPRGYLMRNKRGQGFTTGDLVRAEVPASSKKAGCHVGQVAVRASGSFKRVSGFGCGWPQRNPFLSIGAHEHGTTVESQEHPRVDGWWRA